MSSKKCLNTSKLRTNTENGKRTITAVAWTEVSTQTTVNWNLKRLTTTEASHNFLRDLRLWIIHLTKTTTISLLTRTKWRSVIWRHSRDHHLKSSRNRIWNRSFLVRRTFKTQQVWWIINTQVYLHLRLRLWINLQFMNKFQLLSQ